MMEVVRTSETSVYSEKSIRRYISEDSKLHIRRRWNLKTYTVEIFMTYSVHAGL
jgi:hypothetical protein